MVDWQKMNYDPIFLDYEKYRDFYGLQQPSNDKSTSENGIRFTAQYIIALVKKGLLTPAEKGRLTSLVERCMKRKGLLMRDPSNPSLDSIDNYIGLGVLSFYLRRSWARDAIQYGRKNWGFYDNIVPGRKTVPAAFLWRFPQLSCHLKWVCGMRAGPLEYVSWCFSVFLASFTRDQDRRVLTTMLCIVGNRRGRFTDFLIGLFVRSFGRAYPENGMGRVLSDYYQNPSHPDVKYLDGYFGP